MTIHVDTLGVTFAVALVSACGGSAAPTPPAPTPARTVVVTPDVRPLEAVRFDPGAVECTPVSRRTLDAVAETLLGNPDIKGLLVRVHRDGNGDMAAQRDLADRRARKIMDYLIAKGVASARLRSEGSDTVSTDTTSIVELKVRR